MGKSTQREAAAQWVRDNTEDSETTFDRKDLVLAFGGGAEWKETDAAILKLENAKLKEQLNFFKYGEKNAPLYTGNDSEI